MERIYDLRFTIYDLQWVHGFGRKFGFDSKTHCCRVRARRAAALGVVLRHTIRAIPGAILTADADIRAMAHDSGGAIFGVRIDRASRHACRFHAVVASHREIVANRLRIDAAFDFADAAPENIRRVSILLVAGNHAAFAPDALGHIEMKAILFARAWRQWKRNAETHATPRLDHP